ncbi:MAG: hypothetical protein IK085_07980, partial [Clostridia bacterium]|nr:hypothetical protein [Clostridia bacterium]
SVTEKEKSALCADMGGLLRLAAEGEEYRLSLLRESVKKCCSLFPETESAFFEELLENAGVNKLLKLCSALEHPRSMVSAPQLIPSGSGGRTSDSGFKI